ncbi:hypothetical protein GQX73_g4425 [Xylaria multiplex]|uniref:Uncharacterized protein n=1 Tax=Xylaria multiplex TaxID=323545 RepID=A0A7C8MS56_9PEZI|nr:hypothetical protein GQX73_g4425 [Xylaria multiplex]
MEESGETYAREQAPDIEQVIPKKGLDRVNSKSEVEPRANHANGDDDDDGGDKTATMKIVKKRKEKGEGRTDMEMVCWWCVLVPTPGSSPFGLTEHEAADDPLSFKCPEQFLVDFPCLRTQASDLALLVIGPRVALGGMRVGIPIFKSNYHLLLYTRAAEHLEFGMYCLVRICSSAYILTYRVAQNLHVL